MSVEATTDAIFEYMYENLIDSPKTKEEKKIRYLNNWKTRPTKELPDKPKNSWKLIATVARHRTGQGNTNVLTVERTLQNMAKTAILPIVAAQIQM